MEDLTGCHGFRVEGLGLRILRALSLEYFGSEMGIIAKGLSLRL